MLTPSSFQCEVGGKTLTISTGKLATQATAAVTVTYGETVVLVTLGVSTNPREGIDFLPLTVDYEERLYAAGKIPGGFIRREGRPSQEATLASRLTDRPIRPLLPKAWRREIQIIITVLSVDQQNDPDILAIIGGSTVLSVSSVPFAGPVSAVRVGYINDEYILNPTLAQMEGSALDMVVASTREKVVMLEAGAKEVSEDVVFEAIRFGHEANKAIIDLQEQMRQAIGIPKETTPVQDFSLEMAACVDPLLQVKLEQSLFQADKVDREQWMDDLQAEIAGKLGEQFHRADIAAYIDDQVRKLLRSNILERGRRVSSRALDELRQITCEAGVLPRTHGTGLFNRGRTQVLAITTLGSTRQEQQLDGLGIEETKRFMHHYNFPPFSTGEVRRLGSPGRREIGHGALAERALLPIIPREEDFPYTIRLVSEVLSSNGSTSMASVCAGSLSLMDAGIPVKSPVAGISIGLVTGDDGRFATLTDIEGIEDNYGDMDFKVAGTPEGITAIQLDIKLKGIPFAVIEEALARAKKARFQILETMNRTISTSRVEVSRYAPRMYKMKIDPDKIGAVIGSGGKTIRTITEVTKTTIDIEQDGTVIIGSTDEASARKAIEIIEGLTKEIEVGTVYTGKVTRVLAFGAIVEILPGKDGMVHISELAPYRVANVEDVVKVGDEVTVKVIRVEDGKIALSRKAAFEKPGESAETRPPHTAPHPPPTHRPPMSRDSDQRPPRPPQHRGFPDRKPYP
ncbi:MAG: polyribonucleotide nucleotidyltransferase [Dehalococcoidia bacterium]|nr:polyribonucleotide nucleotidyltransferase [Dehalococcoidia bacterium]